MADTATPIHPAPLPAPPRLLAVGWIRRHHGRTITLRATAAGVTGTITPAVTR
ncbi:MULTISPECIES: hypothetical protein [unclassified Streptomyces]|uniref:hypothetical protein n=1 Tax=unclassified Streptomyces TaxID=2593676 RepID=UPI003659C5F9